MWEMKLNKKVFASASKWNCSWRLQFCLCSEVVASPVSSWNSCLNSSLPQFWVWFQKRCLDLHIPLSCNLKSLSLSRIEILYCSVFLVSSSVLLFCTTSLCTTNGFFLSSVTLPRNQKERVKGGNFNFLCRLRTLDVFSFILSCNFKQRRTTLEMRNPSPSSLLVFPLNFAVLRLSLHVSLFLWHHHLPLLTCISATNSLVLLHVTKSSLFFLLQFCAYLLRVSSLMSLCPWNDFWGIIIIVSFLRLWFLSHTIFLSHSKTLSVLLKRLSLSLLMVLNSAVNSEDSFAFQVRLTLPKHYLRRSERRILRHPKTMMRHEYNSCDKTLATKENQTKTAWKAKWEISRNTKFFLYYTSHIKWYQVWKWNCWRSLHLEVSFACQPNQRNREINVDLKAKTRFSGCESSAIISMSTLKERILRRLIVFLDHVSNV